MEPGGDLSREAGANYFKNVVVVMMLGILTLLQKGT